MLQAIANLGGWLLMMGQHDRSESLFYYFRIEAQCVENLQREDIHPLEEALGFKSLLELGEPYNIAHVAGRAGKSEAYIASGLPKNPWFKIGKVT